MRRVDYLFWKLAEEASEVTQAVSKVMCFGPNEVYNPVGISNVARLVNELNDCIAVIQMLQTERAFNTTGPLLQPMNYGEMELRILAQEIVDLHDKPLVDKIRWVNRMIPDSQNWIVLKMSETLSSVGLLPSWVTMDDLVVAMSKVKGANGY